MKRFVLLLLYAVVIVIAAWPAAAQDNVELASLDISLWPEYDRPEMLVIYRGRLASDTVLPAAVEIRIPARVGQPTAVAYVDSEGQRLNQDFTTSVDGEWLAVSFELSTLAFQLEYYDPMSVDAAGHRSFDFLYVADYDVSVLNLECQVPPTAQDFSLDPPADSASQQGDGLTYHFTSVDSVVSGQTWSWTVTYVKSDAKYTYDILFPAQTPAEPAGDADSGNSVALIILGGFVVLVATGAAGYWLGHRTQPPTPAPPPSRPKRRGSGGGFQFQGAEPLLNDSQEIRFCHRCGTALRPGGQFCQRCGADVRKE